VHSCLATSGVDPCSGPSDPCETGRPAAAGCPDPDVYCERGTCSVERPPAPDRHQGGPLADLPHDARGDRLARGDGTDRPARPKRGTRGDARGDRIARLRHESRRLPVDAAGRALRGEPRRSLGHLPAGTRRPHRSHLGDHPRRDRGRAPPARMAPTATTCRFTLSRAAGVHRVGSASDHLICVGSPLPTVRTTLPVFCPVSTYLVASITSSNG